MEQTNYEKLIETREKEDIQKILEKAAKEYKIHKKEENQAWDMIPRNYCFGKKQVMMAVKIAIRETIKEYNTGVPIK